MLTIKLTRLIYFNVGSDLLSHLHTTIGLYAQIDARQFVFPQRGNKKTVLTIKLTRLIYFNVGSDLLSHLHTTIGLYALASEFGKGSGVSHTI